MLVAFVYALPSIVLNINWHDVFSLVVPANTALKVEPGKAPVAQAFVSVVSTVSDRRRRVVALAERMFTLKNSTCIAV